MLTTPSPPRPPQPQDDELRVFLLVLRRALLLVVGYIDKRYDIPAKDRSQRHA